MQAPAPGSEQEHGTLEYETEGRGLKMWQLPRDSGLPDRNGMGGGSDHVRALALKPEASSRSAQPGRLDRGSATHLCLKTSGSGGSEFQVWLADQANYALHILTQRV